MPTDQEARAAAYGIVLTDLNELLDLANSSDAWTKENETPENAVLRTVYSWALNRHIELDPDEYLDVL